MSKESPSRLRILIADDSEVCCSLLGMVLKKADYEVVCVFDGVQAVETARTRPFDLVMLDNDMPRLDGLGAMAYLRAFFPTLPVIICSGTYSSEQEARYEAMGTAAMVRKPVDPLRLRELVTRILSDRAAAPTSHSTAPETQPSPKVVDRVLEKPIFVGRSEAVRKLATDFQRVRRFKTAATIEGPRGAGFLDLAVAMAETKECLMSACSAQEVSEERVEKLVVPAMQRGLPATLIVTGAEKLARSQQSQLETMLRSRGESARVRLILCASASLHDLADQGGFDEDLMLRAGAMRLRLPPIAKSMEDLPSMAKSILRRIGLSRIAFSDSAGSWLSLQLWPGDYLQFHRTVELAGALATEAGTLEPHHLESARVKEPAYHLPLFHELALESLREPVECRDQE